MLLRFSKCCIPLFSRKVFEVCTLWCAGSLCISPFTNTGYYHSVIIPVDLRILPRVVSIIRALISTAQAVDEVLHICCSLSCTLLMLFALREKGKKILFFESICHLLYTHLTPHFMAWNCLAYYQYSLI